VRAMTPILGSACVSRSIHGAQVPGDRSAVLRATANLGRRTRKVAELAIASPRCVFPAPPKAR
jgi:hypothetical protein